MKHALLTTLALSLVGIGLVYADIKTDYSHSTDFRNFKTYSWLKVDAGNSLWTDRIRRDVDEQLMAKGLTMQQSGGDIAVTAMGHTKQEQSYTTFYDGLGGWGWRGFGDNLATTSVQETPVGTLTVDLFDGHTKKLLWRSVSTKTLSDNPEKNEKKLQGTVADMFKKFPPKGE